MSNTIVKPLFLPSLCVGFLHAFSGASWAADPAPSRTPTSVERISGIDSQFLDNSVRAQDDFYQHVNGRWLLTTKIPADRSRYDAFDKLEEDSFAQLRAIVESLQKSNGTADADHKKIIDLYASFMDEAALDSLGLEPLKAEFDRIDTVSRRPQIAGLIAHFNRIGVAAPFTPQVHQDAKDATQYVFDLGQDGLGLPDRDYYLSNDRKLAQIRHEYGDHVAKMLALAGDRRATLEAQGILKFETALARAQWTKVQNRDPAKTYSKFSMTKLSMLAPRFDWSLYLTESGVKGKIDYLVVSQPTYVRTLSRILTSVPLPALKAYFRWRLLSDLSPYLNKPFVDEHFAFYGTALRGTPENQPRWKRGLALLESAIGEALGKLYVTQYFPPQSKARMDQLVKNLLAAYKTDIDTLDWLSPQTKQRAQAKLAKLTAKIGYPTRWRDYSALHVVNGELLGNVIRAQSFDYDRNLGKIGTPIDREEWLMTPQTINAYYDPEKNEIVFPAAVLQPPFFNADADDAVNYGGIGAVIGHEISHGFDDQGSQYDGDGNLLSEPGWFTQADFENYKTKTHALVDQYSAEEPIPGFHVNGELTLGENIADNAGLAIAYKAYELSLGGKNSPMIDGLTGEQRLYTGWAQSWREKIREDEEILEIKTDPHSPEMIRGKLPLMNQTAFHQAFAIKPGDKMYLSPARRVTLW